MKKRQKNTPFQEGSGGGAQKNSNRRKNKNNRKKGKGAKEGEMIEVRGYANLKQKKKVNLCKGLPPEKKARVWRGKTGKGKRRPALPWETTPWDQTSRGGFNSHGKKVRAFSERHIGGRKNQSFMGKKQTSVQKKKKQATRKSPASKDWGR